MAKKATVDIYSDVTGEKLERSYPVGVLFDNKMHVVDLDRDNLDHDLTQLTLAQAIEIGRIENMRRNTRGSLNSELHRKARIWAQENGIEVGVRGIVPKEILDEYRRWCEENGVEYEEEFDI